MFVRVRRKAVMHARRKKLKTNFFQYNQPKRHFSPDIHHVDSSVYTLTGKEIPQLFRGVQGSCLKGADGIAHVFDTMFGCTSNFNSYNPELTILNNEMFAKNKEWAAFGVPMSLSRSMSLGSAGEDGCVLSINFNAYNNILLIDSETAYFKKWGDYYSEGEEQEWISFLIPQGAIQKFYLSGGDNLIQFQNPFFLQVDSNDLVIKKEIQECYNAHCRLIHGFFLNKIDPSLVSAESLQKLKINYLEKHFSLYEKCYSENNPYRLSVNAFKEKYPEYASVIRKLSANPLSLALNSPPAMFGNKSVQHIVLRGRSINEFAEQFDLPKDRYETDANLRLALMQDNRIDNKIKL